MPSSGGLQGSWGVDVLTMTASGTCSVWTGAELLNRTEAGALFAFHR